VLFGGRSLGGACHWQSVHSTVQNLAHVDRAFAAAGLGRWDHGLDNRPFSHRLAIMANVDLPSAEMEMGGVQTAARTLGLEVVPAEIRRAEDIAPAFEGLKGRADALYVVGDALVITHRIRINTLALAARLPTIYYFREYVEVGGLMSYGPNIPDLFRRAADYVDKILRGAKPGEIPVEQATKFDLVINLTTAKALGLTIPETFLVRADEVIE